MNTPISAARPMPAVIASGVARPSAQGQAEARTETKHVMASSNRGSGPHRSHAAAANTAKAIAAGTNQAAILST